MYLCKCVCVCVCVCGSTSFVVTVCLQTHTPFEELYLGKKKEEKAAMWVWVRNVAVEKVKKKKGREKEDMKKAYLSSQHVKRRE